MGLVVVVLVVREGGGEGESTTRLSHSDILSASVKLSPSARFPDRLLLLLLAVGLAGLRGCWWLSLCRWCWLCLLVSGLLSSGKVVVVVVSSSPESNVSVSSVSKISSSSYLL